MRNSLQKISCSCVQRYARTQSSRADPRDFFFLPHPVPATDGRLNRKLTPLDRSTNLKTQRRGFRNAVLRRVFFFSSFGSRMYFYQFDIEAHGLRWNVMKWALVNNFTFALSPWLITRIGFFLINTHIFLIDIAKTMESTISNPKGHTFLLFSHIINLYVERWHQIFLIS